MNVEHRRQLGRQEGVRTVMMMLATPGVLDTLVRDRQRRLRHRPHTTARPGVLRVRLGHALIQAGANLSGERVERAARSQRLSPASR
jgi:hypothetical protein